MKLRSEPKQKTERLLITDEWATNNRPMGPWPNAGTNRTEEEEGGEGEGLVSSSASYDVEHIDGNLPRRRRWIFTHTISPSSTSISTFPIRSSIPSLAPLRDPLLIRSQLMVTLPCQIPALQGTGMMAPRPSPSAWIGALPLGNGYATILILILIFFRFWFPGNEGRGRQEFLNWWREEFDNFESRVLLGCWGNWGEWEKMEIWIVPSVWMTRKRGIRERVPKIPEKRSLHYKLVTTHWKIF